VIAARVDAHVDRRRHVAVDAAQAGRLLRVTMMRGVGETFSRMTLRADLVARRAELARMRIVAVGAGHARRIHPALQERPEFEDFVALLAIGVIEGRLEQRRMKSVKKTRDARGIVGELRASRVAAGADENFLMRLHRRRTKGLALVVHWPMRVTPLV